jgi:hypothetical protein
MSIVRRDSACSDGACVRAEMSVQP